MNKYCKIFSCGCLLIITALMLSGCWNRNELIDLSIVLALGVDKVGNEYEVSVQTIDPSSMSRNRSTNRAPTTVFSEREPTVFEALRKMTTKSPRRMYVSHLRFIVFDEATAREGIHNPLDFLFREQEIRPDFNMAVAKDCKAKDIIGFVSPTEVLPGMDMYKSLKTSERVWSPTSAVNVREIMSKLVMEGVEPVLTGLALHGDIKQGGTSENVKKPVPLANYVYEGIGIFKDDKLIGWMNEDESRGYSYITNNAKSSVARAKCPDGGKGWFNVELIRSKAKIEPSIKNDRPHIKVRVQSQGNIGEVQCAVDLMDPEMHRKFQETISNKLNAALDDSVKRAKEYGVDVFGSFIASIRSFGENGRVDGEKCSKMSLSWIFKWSFRFYCMEKSTTRSL